MKICYGLLILATISWVACGNVDRNKESSAGNENTLTQEVSKTIAGGTSDVSFKDKNGNTVSLNSLKGKVVFINFWASWWLCHWSCGFLYLPGKAQNRSGQKNILMMME